MIIDLSKLDDREKRHYLRVQGDLSKRFGPDNERVDRIIRKAAEGIRTTDAAMDTASFKQAKDVLTDIRTTPAVWIAEDDNRGSIIYGYYREFDIILTNPTLSRCALEIEGLV